MLIDGTTGAPLAASPADDHQRYLEKLGRPSSGMSTSLGQVSLLALLLQMSVFVNQNS